MKIIQSINPRNWSFKNKIILAVCGLPIMATADVLLFRIIFGFSLPYFYYIIASFWEVVFFISGYILGKEARN